MVTQIKFKQKIELYTQVELTEDLPKYGLKKGAIAMVIEHYPMPENQEDGYSLEGFDREIEGITVEVRASQIKPISISINITLEPDVAEVFKTSEEVNRALRNLITAIPKS
jgi:hypothetical protein